MNFFNENINTRYGEWKYFSNDKAIGKDIKDACIDAIIRERELGHNIHVVVGSDSNINGRTVKFATVICFMRERKGAFMFYREKFVTNNGKYFRKPKLKERMLLEAVETVMVLHDIADTLQELNIYFEGHIDVNTKGKGDSSIALQEAKGYLAGMDFPVRVKPNAHVATYAADKKC